MKRVLSLVLALVLVFGTIMPAFAEDAATTAADSQAAQDLVSYGVIAGTDKGLEEASVLTREQMTVILSELYGMKAEAEAYAFAPSFTDVEEGKWSTPYIAFAETKGWMSGDAAGGTFRPTDVMKAQEVNAMFVKALGYTVEWNDVNAKAEELEVAITAADATSVLRGEAFAALRATLDVPQMDGTDTLGTVLALPNYVSPVPPTPEALEVVSVKAINLIQVEVVFNQEVDADSAEDADNYDVEEMEITDAALQADMTTVVLTLTEAASQQDELDVTVDAVETAEEVALEEVVFEDVAFLDTTIPTVLSAEVVGIDTIKVTFSEPMTAASLEAKANYSVDGGDLYINTVEAVNNNTEANITLYSDLEEGDVTVKVKAAVEDEAGFGVVQDTLTATVTEDEDAPVVVAYKDATTTGVTLVFNEEIEIADTAVENYYHTNSSNTTKDVLVAADVLSTDGKELTLDFSDAELPEGTAYVYILKESVNDLWDNENAQIMFKIEVTIDETAPEVDSVTVKTEEQIQVKFTEAVDADMAEDEDNYTILDSDGEEVEDIIEDINFSSKTATIDFNDTLSGDYSIVIKNIEDPAENEMATATVEFSVDDLTAPVFTDFSATVYNSGDASQMIRIAFGEEMNAEGTYSVVDPANYTINGVALTDLVDDYDAEIALVNNGSAVQITCPIDTSDAGDDANGVDLVAGVGAANGIELARVADAAGNYTVAYTGAIDIVSAANVLIDDVEITAVDTVVVTFDDLLDEFEAADLEIQANGVALELSKRAISMDSDGNTVVTLTLIDELTFTGLSGTYAVSAVIVDADDDVDTDPASENKFGETLLVTDAKVGTDDISPELYDDGVATVEFAYEDYLTFTTAGTFTVKFTEAVEAVDDNFVLAGADFVVKADNDTLTNGVDYIVTGISGDTIAFAFLNDYEGFSGDVTIDRAATTNHVTDASDNKLDAFESDEFTVDNAPYYDLGEAKAAEALLTSTDYVDYTDVEDALLLPESTLAEAAAKATAINDAIDALVEV